MTSGAMNSTSRESQSRTRVGFVPGVPHEKGIEWAVRSRAWALLKHTCVALGSVYCRASHSLVIQDRTGQSSVLRAEISAQE